MEKFKECLKIGFDKLSWINENSEEKFVTYFKNFSNEDSKRFIENYFGKRKKSSVIRGIYVDKSISNKGTHSVSVYLLGMYFQDILNLENLNNEQYLKQYPFEYLWFMTALYHDLDSAIENKIESKDMYNSLKCMKISSFEQLAKYIVTKIDEQEVESDIFELNSIPTYNSTLIANYFKYRIEKCGKVDHGIVAGVLAYSKLCNNLKEKFKFSDADKIIDYNMEFCRTDNIAYGMVADAIIAHNMWFAYTPNKIDEYNKYGLECLIYDTKHNNGLSIRDNPLSFYLGLLDTIEPFKYFDKKDCKYKTDCSCQCMDRKDIAESILFSVSKNKIEISVNGEININRWYNDKIRELQYWLKVKCDFDGEKITINILE